MDPLQLISENKAVCCFNLIWFFEQHERLGRFVNDMMANMEWKAPYIGHEFPFEDAKEALRFFQGGTNIGKIVLKLPPPQ